VIVALAVLAGVGSYVASSGALTNVFGPHPPVGPNPTNYSVVPYTSSVDGYALSYAEWLPEPFNNSASYPLVVYLHGQQDTSGTWYPGGLTDDLVQSLTGPPTADQRTAEALINASRAQPAILIALNTRSGSGWYIDSPCGGPQEQDVLDAIAQERARYHVDGVYLMGQSMGSAGTLFVAGANPGLFAGVAIIAPVTDLFEDVAYRMTLVTNPLDPWANVSIQAKAHLFCGSLPGSGNASQESVARMFQNMSPLRFDPAAFHDVPVYLTAGGLDDRAPNNVSIWPGWMNANNTFVNATCDRAAALDEPLVVDCANTTFDSLHRADPGGYTFRYVYEPDATHAVAQLDPTDLFAFWFGGAPGGYYLGSPLSGPIVAAPGLVY